MWFNPPDQPGFWLANNRSGVSMLTEHITRQLKQVVPAENLDDVLSGINRALPPDETLKNITPLHGGMSAKVFTVETNIRTLVLRIIPRRKNHLEFNREVFFSRVMSEQKTGPGLIYAGLGDGIIIMDHLQNRTHISGKTPSYTDHYLKCLARLLKRLHAIPSENFGFEVSIFDRTSAIRDRLPSPSPERADFVFRKTRLIEQLLKPHIRPCLVHHDLNPNNVLDDGRRLWLIDWELTGRGNPWYDLANALIFFTGDPFQETLFLNEYLGCPPSALEKALVWLCKIQCLSFYGHVLQIVANNDDFSDFDRQLHTLPDLPQILQQGCRWADFSGGPSSVSRFGMILLKEAHRMIHHPNFAASINIVRSGPAAPEASLRQCLGR